LVSAAKDYIRIWLQVGGNGDLTVTSGLPSASGLYADFQSAQFISPQDAAGSLLGSPFPNSPPTSIHLGGGTAKLIGYGISDLAIVWSQGSWTFVVSGKDQSQDVATARQLVAYFAANALPAGPGLYQMRYADADDISTINWVQDNSTLLVDATGSDPTLAAQWRRLCLGYLSGGFLGYSLTRRARTSLPPYTPVRCSPSLGACVCSISTTGSPSPTAMLLSTLSSPRARLTLAGCLALSAELAGVDHPFRVCCLCVRAVWDTKNQQEA
jgi:hypothetical protein